MSIPDSRVPVILQKEPNFAFLEVNTVQQDRPKSTLPLTLMILEPPRDVDSFHLLKINTQSIWDTSPSIMDSTYVLTSKGTPEDFVETNHYNEFQQVQTSKCQCVVIVANNQAHQICFWNQKTEYSRNLTTLSYKSRQFRESFLITEKKVKY